MEASIWPGITRLLKLKGLHFRLFWDRYESDTPHKFGDGSYGETVEFNSINLSLAYDISLNNHFTLTPRYAYRYQEDWWISRDSAVNPISDFHLPASQHTVNLDLKYVSSLWNGLLGLEYKEERGEAFRDPDIEVINSSDLRDSKIDAEETTQYELEIGYHPTENLYGTLSLFRVENENPIIYSSTGTGYYYSNRSQSTTQGLETTWSFQKNNCRVTFGYSFYTAIHTPEPFSVPQDDEQNLGAPRHKITLSLNYRIPGNRWSLKPNIVWYSRYYAYDYQAGASDPDGDEIASQSKSSKTFVNLSVQYKHSQNWSLDLGITDIFNQVRKYPQPYNDASTPYTGAGRTVFMSFSYKWKF